MHNLSLRLFLPLVLLPPLLVSVACPGPDPAMRTVQGEDGEDGSDAGDGSGGSRGSGGSMTPRAGSGGSSGSGGSGTGGNSGRGGSGLVEDAAAPMNMDPRPPAQLDMMVAVVRQDMMPPQRPPDMGGGGKQALLVVRDPATPTMGDTVLEDQLKGRGFTVTRMDDDIVTVADADAKSLVVISSAVSETSLMGKLAGTKTGVLNLKKEVLDDMGMTGTTIGTDFGPVPNQTAIAITKADHPLAAGFPVGNVTVSTSHSFAFAVPGPNAIKVATVVGMANQTTIFAYSANTMMVGRMAPGKRVGLFMQDTVLGGVNADGLKILNAAIDWTYLK